MKNNIQLLLSLSFIVLSIQVFASNSGVVKSVSCRDNIKDTIEFTMRWDFNGDCGTDCYKFIGTGTISAINGKAVNGSCDNIFVKCPSRLNLKQGKQYTFIAIPFTPNNCSTTIDFCTPNKTFLLVKPVN